jgi:branched-chain amino acid transport system permease protein
MPGEASALTFVVIGLFQGVLYGLLAVGMVLVYKGARVFNFAQGEFGSVAAFVTLGILTVMSDNPQAPSGVEMTLAVGGGLLSALLLGVIMERLIVRPLFDASRITLLVATVGFTLLVAAFVFIVAKPETRVLPPLIAGGVGGTGILGASVQYQQFLMAGVLIALAVLLALFFRYTNLGLAVLAVSQDPLATRMMGVSVTGVSRFIWGFAAFLGGVAGVLQAGIPGYSFYPGFMTREFLVPAFTGAVLGGMTSLPGAFIGGLLVGILQNLGIYYLGNQFQWPGPSDVTIFVVLLLVLLIRPRGLLGREA